MRVSSIRQSLRNVSDMQRQLRAHATFSCEKPCHLDRLAAMKIRQRGGNLSDTHTAHVAFDLPADTGFDLRRAVLQLESHQRQPGGRVA